METRVLIRSDPKPNAAFPQPNDASHKIWLRSTCWFQRYSCLKVWTHARTDARTHRRTPARPVSYKLTLWAFGSGELKMHYFLFFCDIGAATWENLIFAYAKTKTQISFAVTLKLISVFVYATRIVQSLFFLNPKFQVPSHLQWLPSPVCVGPGRKPRTGFLTSRLI